ncbi:unnamed protein product [Parnassius apollo]|uniref:(apollo) hypothetical protein n=1 Tax=Parnassius apollo TaxID=110799 RepID=A0A8S3WV73_PARAO|nr:unnamed protein product [Parnassius apollo]
MLSNISKLFDPLGWLSPSTIKAKLLFQRLWSEHTEWDQLLSPDIQHEWSKLKEELKNISKIKIPRWVGNTQSLVQLHGFADASERAYAAVIYIKTYNEHKKPRIHLIAAKTKLAPQKKRITLPRLELCGAVLLSKLMQKVIVSMSLAQDKLQIHGWTDSMVVLGWIHGNTARWKTYVANRVNEIIKVIPSSCWRHTKSEHNAADCATRGLSPSQLLSYSLWWNGPSWLKENKEYPPEKYEAPEFELKTKPRICAAETTHSPFISKLLYKYSSVTKATRVLCRVLRFITNARERVRDNSNFYPSYITVNEIKYATKLIIKSIQLDNFAQEIEQLKRNGNISRKSAIISLNPFLDKDGILRMKGRLQHSTLPTTSKQPIVLPYHSRLTDLLILEAHHTTLHGGVKLTLAYIRNKYWIISGQRAVKKIIGRCTTCVRLNTQKRTQIMGDLPTPRVVPSRPFTHTGGGLYGTC